MTAVHNQTVRIAPPLDLDFFADTARLIVVF